MGWKGAPDVSKRFEKRDGKARYSHAFSSEQAAQVPARRQCQEPISARLGARASTVLEIDARSPH